jgi:uncharacterized membrane protein
MGIWQLTCKESEQIVRSMAAADAKTNQGVSALVHLYRGEIARADAWRARLDNSTNWALTTTAAVLSFGLGSAAAPHAVILIGMYLVLNFLLIETRRYRTWDVYLRRVRLLENSVFVPLLRGEPIDPPAMHELAQMLAVPRVLIPFWIALGQRIKRAYGPVLGVLLAAWVVKLMLHHTEIRSFGDFVDRAHIGFVHGTVVLAVVAATYLSVLGIIVSSFWVTPPTTELLATPRRRRRTLREALERGLART